MPSLCRRSTARAIASAQRHLLAQAELHFPALRHTMRFPHVAGFSGAAEEQSSDVFARATLAGVLLDCAELARDAPAFAEAVAVVTRREADYVASARLRDRHGGWSYFPELPELPPDADSLAAALSLFVRAAPEHVPLCHEPLRLVLAGQRPNGAVGTWIIAPTDDPRQRRTMRWGVERCWGGAVDVEVCANLFRALLRLDLAAHERELARGTDLILSRQAADGSWEAGWYWGPVCGLGLCVDFLRDRGAGEAARARALEYLRSNQRADGGWGRLESTPLETAVALWAAGSTGLASGRVDVEAALAYLLSRQGPDGGWAGSPWIKMEIGRAWGRVVRTATYHSATMSTALCLRSLLLTKFGWRVHVPLPSFRRSPG